jgi:hypothetical protein
MCTRQFACRRPMLDPLATLALATARSALVLVRAPTRQPPAGSGRKHWASSAPRLNKSGAPLAPSGRPARSNARRSAAGCCITRHCGSVRSPRRHSRHGRRPAVGGRIPLAAAQSALRSRPGRGRRCRIWCITAASEGPESGGEAAFAERHQKLSGRLSRRPCAHRTITSTRRELAGANGKSASWSVETENQKCTLPFPGAGDHTPGTTCHDGMKPHGTTPSRAG